jgi:hypothetical protein
MNVGAGVPAGAGQNYPHNGSRIEPTVQAVGRQVKDEQAPEERKNSCDTGFVWVGYGQLRDEPKRS